MEEAVERVDEEVVGGLLDAGFYTLPAWHVHDSSTIFVHLFDEACMPRFTDQVNLGMQKRKQSNLRYTQKRKLLGIPKIGRAFNGEACNILYYI